MLQETFFSSLEHFFEENDSCARTSMKTKLTYLLSIQGQMIFAFFHVGKNENRSFYPYV